VIRWPNLARFNADAVVVASDNGFAHALFFRRWQDAQKAEKTLLSLSFTRDSALHNLYHLAPPLGFDRKTIQSIFPSFGNEDIQTLSSLSDVALEVKATQNQADIAVGAPTPMSPPPAVAPVNPASLPAPLTDTKNPSEKPSDDDKNPGDINDTGQKNQIEDVGEKIGMARKDMGDVRRLLMRGNKEEAISAISLLNELEVRDNAVRSRLVPMPSFREMIAAGISPSACWLMREAIVKIIPSKPKIYRGSDPVYTKKQIEEYVGKAVLLRECIETAKFQCLDYGFVRPDDIPGAERQEKIVSDVVLGTFTPINGATIPSVFYSRSVSDWRRNTLNGLNPGGKNWVDARSDRMSRKTPGDADTGDDGDSGDDRKPISKPKKAEMMRQCPPHLDISDRHGRDVTASDFMESFGFRAVEFGNWVSQKERQENVNMAYDSLYDLALITGLHPKMMSLDGNLALAFGSRGRGGRAAAHFEPARCVINLTKPGGDGCLAHEWGHAFDNVMQGLLSDITGNARFDMSSDNLFLSKTALKTPFEINEDIEERIKNEYTSSPLYQSPLKLWAWEVAGRMSEVMRSTHHRQLTAAEDMDWFDTRIVGECNGSWLRGLVSYVRAPTEVSAKFYDDCLAYIKEMGREISGSNVEFPASQVTERCEAIVSNVKSQLKAMKKKSDAIGLLSPILDLERLTKYEKKSIDAIETNSRIGLNRLVGEHGTANTMFFKNAEKADKSRSKKYWSTPHEMFARSFESFVHDCLQKKGIKSDYLVSDDVGAPDNDRYPAETERVAIESCMKPLMEASRFVMNRHLSSNDTNSELEEALTVKSW